MVSRKGFLLTKVSVLKAFPNSKAALTVKNRNEVHRRQNTKNTERTEGAKGYRVETFGSLCSASYKKERK